MYTQRVQDAVAAGFSLDEIYGQAHQEYSDMISAGFAHDEASDYIKGYWGINVRTSEETAEGMQTFEDFLDSTDEDANQSFTNENDFLQAGIDQEREAAEREQRIAEERAKLPSNRNYTTEELRDYGLYESRDSRVLAGSDRPLTPEDRAIQEFMYNEGEIQVPETPTQPMLVSGAGSRYPTVWNESKEVESVGEALLSGYQNSATGLYLREQNPNLYMRSDAPLRYKLAYAAGMLPGDLPTLIAGGAGGAIAGGATPAAAATAAGGAVGLTEAVKAGMRYAYENGDAFQAADYAKQSEMISQMGREVFYEGAKGIAIGVSGGATNVGVNALLKGVASKASPALYSTATGTLGEATRSALLGVATPAAEITAMTYTSALLNNQVPTADDFIVAGSLVGGMRLSSFYSSKLANVWQRTDMNPKTLIDYGRRVDPSVTEDVASANTTVPRALGGDYIPLHSIVGGPKVTTPSGKGQWMYLSKTLADAHAQNLNKRNGIADPLAETAFKSEGYTIPADTNLLWIRSKNDPNKARLYRQFLEESNPGEKAPEGNTLREGANLAFQSPSPEFMEFLMSGRGRLGPKEETPLRDIKGLRLYEDKLLMFDTKDLVKGDAFEAISKSLDVAVDEVANSASVGVVPKIPFKKAMHWSYQATIDKFQPLNATATPGHVTVPYLSARLYMGVDGLARHWLTKGRTAFALPQVGGPGGQTRAINGPSLQDIFNQGKLKPGTKFSDMVDGALDSVNRLIKENSIADTAELQTALRNAFEEGALNKQEYSNAQARIVEINKAAEFSKTDPLYLFRTYVMSKHAVDLANRGIDAGIDLSAAKTIANNKGMQKRFEAASQELYRYQRALMQYQVDAGLISKATYNKMIAQNPNYVPFNRVLDIDGAPTSTGTFRIGGSKRDIIDPFESIVRQTFYTIQAAEKNATFRIIAKEFGEPVKGRDTKSTAVGTMRELNALDNTSRADPRNTIKYKVAGKEQSAIVPTDIAKTASLLDPISSKVYNGLLKGASGVAGVLRAGAIFHPGFAARNFFRDQFSAAINSDSGYRAFWDFGKGLAAITSEKTGGLLFPKLEGYYAEWQRHGGSHAALVSQDRNYTQQVMKTLMQENNVTNSYPLSLPGLETIAQKINPLNWPRAAYETLQRVSELSEEGTRVAEFIRAREQGVSPMEAAYRSREVTMDFARIGANMKALNSMSVFLNAQIQGADRTIRQLRAHPERTISRIVAGVALPSFLLSLVRNDYIHNSADSEVANALREVPDWQRQMFWIVPSSEGVFRIPKPHEFGIPFANPIESFVDYMYDNDPDKNFLRNLYDEGYFGAVADQFFLNPLTLISSLTPSALLPIGEVVTNYSYFTGSPVIPPSMEKELPETRYNRNTTELSKTLSRYLSKIDPLLDSNYTQRLISPPAIDHLIAGYTGSIGRDLWAYMDEIAQAAGIVDKITKPEKKLEDMPFINNFMIKYPNSGSRSIERFYEDSTRFEQGLASATALFKEGTESSLARAERILMEENIGRVTAIRSAMGATSRYIRTVHFHPDFTAEEKRRYIDAMYLQMIEMAKAGNQLLKAIEQENKARKEGQMP